MVAVTLVVILGGLALVSRRYRAVRRDVVCRLAEQRANSAAHGPRAGAPESAALGPVARSRATGAGVLLGAGTALL